MGRGGAVLKRLDQLIFETGFKIMSKDSAINDVCSKLGRMINSGELLICKEDRDFESLLSSCFSLAYRELDVSTLGWKIEFSSMLQMAGVQDDTTRYLIDRNLFTLCTWLVDRLGWVEIDDPEGYIAMHLGEVKSEDVRNLIADISSYAPRTTLEFRRRYMLMVILSVVDSIPGELFKSPLVKIRMRKLGQVDDKEDKRAASRRKQDVIPAQEDLLPDLTGSPRQIDWANTIRHEWLMCRDRLVDSLGSDGEDSTRVWEAIDSLTIILLELKVAGEWIDRRAVNNMAIYASSIYESRHGIPLDGGKVRALFHHNYRG